MITFSTRSRQLGALKAGDHAAVRADIAAVRAACRDRVLKVIIERGRRRPRPPPPCPEASRRRGESRRPSRARRCCRTNVAPCSVVGFPLGAVMPQDKAAEAAGAVARGAGLQGAERDHHVDLARAAGDGARGLRRLVLRHHGAASGQGGGGRGRRRPRRGRDRHGDRARRPEGRGSRATLLPDRISATSPTWTGLTQTALKRCASASSQRRRPPPRCGASATRRWRTASRPSASTRSMSGWWPRYASTKKKSSRSRPDPPARLRRDSHRRARAVKRCVRDHLHRAGRRLRREGGGGDPRGLGALTHRLTARARRTSAAVASARRSV
jgi:hypothetical protein